MGEKELVIFIILINTILFIFIIGITLFIYQYRKRKILHSKELLKVNNEHNKAILLAQLQAQEHTMIHIGNDIHDGVGQKLTLASLYLHKVSMKNKKTETSNSLDEVNDLINEALHELRLLSKTLINPELSQLGLLDLISLDIKRINDIKATEVEVNVNGDYFELQENFKNNAYRIIQEFLQNSIKHSQCSKVIIMLDYNLPILNVKCEDNGIGFVYETSNKGIGLTNINRRIQEMNGDIDFSSTLKKGTILHFTLDNCYGKSDL